MAGGFREWKMNDIQDTVSDFRDSIFDFRHNSEAEFLTAHLS